METIEYIAPREYFNLLEDFTNQQSKSDTYIDMIKRLNFLQFKPLRDITQNYSYCRSISGAYQGFKLAVSDYNLAKVEAEIANLPSEYKTHEEYIEAQTDRCKSLLDHLYHTIAAYNLEKLYDQAENDKTVVAYSHRRRGWSFPMRTISEKFQFRFKTNFGYGSKVYFFLQVIYDGFKLVKYSDVVRYESKPIYEICEYTTTYKVSETSWIEVNKELVTMYEDSKNLEYFIDKYVVSECRRMIDGLLELLTNDEFKFEDASRINHLPEDVSHFINEIRGIKIVSALNMFRISIYKCPYLNSDEILKQLTKMGRDLLPILDNESALIKEKLLQFEERIQNNLQQMNNELSHAKAVINELQLYIQKMIRKAQVQSTDLHVYTTSLRREFFAGREDDQKLVIKHEKLSNENSEFKRRIVSLKHVRKKIAESVLEINKLLEPK